MPSCRLDVLAEQVSLPQSYADLQEKIIALSGDVAVSVPLTEVAHAAAEPPPMARFEMTLNAEASIEFAELGNLELHPFRVSCDDQELFVGVGYTIYGAAGIAAPVLHVEEEDGAVALRIGAWQGVWLVGLGGGEMEQELRARLERAELRAAFCARGALDTLE